MREGGKEKERKLGNQQQLHLFPKRGMNDWGLWEIEEVRGRELKTVLTTTVEYREAIQSLYRSLKVVIISLALLPSHSISLFFGFRCFRVVVVLAKKDKGRRESSRLVDMFGKGTIFPSFSSSLLFPFSVNSFFLLATSVTRDLSPSVVSWIATRQTRRTRVGH